MSEKGVKILVASAYDVGGASIAAIRMHLGFLQAGADSRLLTLHASSDQIPAHYRFSPAADSMNRLKLKWKQRKDHKSKQSLHLPENQSLSGEFSLPVAPFDLSQSPLWHWADIVILHWVNEWLQFDSLMELAKQKPFIWVMHDMHAFSGGCHYNHGCEGLTKSCDICPLLEKSNQPHLAHRFLLEKRKAMEQFRPNLSITAPSRWMVNWSKQSALFKGLPHHHIFNSLDTQIFSLRDKIACRKVLALPLDKKIALCVVQNLNDHRKGFHLLLEAMKDPKIKDQLLLCSVGKLKSASHFTDIEHVHLGSIHDERLMAIIYNAADFLIHPAIEDNLPNVVIEGLACGLPCAGFEIGGMPEMIQNGQNGILATETQTMALVEAVKQIMNQDWDSQKIARDAAGEFALHIQAERFLSLIKTLT